MPRRDFIAELREQVLVGDGAMGTVLFARGVAAPETGVERLNVLAPTQVLALHQEYIAAGSQVIETNTFAANRLNLARYGTEQQVWEINLAGAHLARQAAGTGVYVAGAIGPLPEIDGEPVTQDIRTALFTEQISALLDGEVDVLLFETFSDNPE